MQKKNVLLRPRLYSSVKKEFLFNPPPTIYPLNKLSVKSNSKCEPLVKWNRYSEAKYFLGIFMPSHYIPISKLCFAVEKEDIFFLPIMKVESYFYTVSFIYTFFTKIFLYHLSNLPLFFITFVSIKRSNCLFRDIYGKNINTMTIYFGKHFWNIIIIESFLNRRLACEENFVSTNLLYS